MTLSFRWEWESAPEVRLPELATTWCRLTIDLDSTPVTLVERRDGSGGPRHGIDVAAYPLAEFLALNWWRLNARSHLPADRGVSLVHAGEGFAWPDLTLRSDRGLMWATLRQRNQEPEHVRFLTQTEAVLDAEAVVMDIADLIDSTVRRLEDNGVTGTLLQEEWAAIQQADQAERDYCVVAAAWGQDPYDTSADIEELLLVAGERMDDAELLADLARAVPPERILSSTNWLLDASQALDPQEGNLPPTGPLTWSATAGAAPWKIGYKLARQFRDILGLNPADAVPIGEMVRVRQTESVAPINVDGLVRSVGPSDLAVVVGAYTSERSRRFAAARAIGRRSLSPIEGLSLLTRAPKYGEQSERAFAAELLAPASGIAEVTAGDFSDTSLEKAAEYFDVSPILIQHQIENQIAA